MSKEQTLVILMPGFPKDEADTNCLPFPQLFVKNLKAQNPGLNIIVLAFQYPHSLQPYRWHGVMVFPFNGRNKGQLNRLLVWNAVWVRLKQIKRENRLLGILSFWMGECALIGKYASKKYQVKHFTWLQGQDAKSNNRFVSLLRPQPGNIIALSDFLSDEFNRNYGIRPAHVIASGIDETLFDPLPENRTIDIMGAGSLIPLKRYDMFIRVIAKLIKQFPELNCIVCGDGPGLEKLQNMISEKGLENNVRLKGALLHKEVLSLMQSSKIFLHTSSYEGFSTVCNEALYAGAAVISFCKPMHVDFRNMHIVSAEHEIENLLKTFLLKKAAVRERVLTYSMTDTCKQVLDLYRQVPVFEPRS